MDKHKFFLVNHSHKDVMEKHFDILFKVLSYSKTFLFIAKLKIMILQLLFETNYYSEILICTKFLFYYHHFIDSLVCLYFS